MRILHTSDWHLGRSFKNVPLLDEQVGFVDQVVDIVDSEGVDLVVVAGDVFDRGFPPSDAVEVWHDALVRIVEAGAQVVAISGNHDQGERIEIPARLTREGVVVRGRREATPVILGFADGPLVVVPIPFLDPFMARELSESEGPATHQSVIEGALAPIREIVRDAPRSLAASHAFVRGGIESESERSLLLVGGAELVDARVFAGFTYTALGHLHRPQEVGGDPSVAYCGSPLPYSFSEDHDKTVRLVEMSADGGDIKVEVIPVEAGWPVVTIRDSFENIISDPGYSGYEKRHFVRALISGVEQHTDPMNRLRRRFEGVIDLDFPDHGFGGDQLPDIDPEGGANPRELADDFWMDATGRSPFKPEGVLLDGAIRAGFGNVEVSA